MPVLLRDRDEFVIGAAVLGTGLGVLNLAYTSDWGWILAVLMLPALIVRAFWRSMPGWLLLSWVTIPTVVGDAAVVTQSAYLVVVTALAVVAASRRRRLDTVVMVVCLLSPFLIWLLETNNWHRGIGAWLWFGGLLIGWGFGHVVGRQFALIDELERTRTKLAETAVAEDRQRIARDLHDLVGHSFSVVLLHLSGARMILTSSPGELAEAAAALRQAEDVGRKGMDELRQALMLMHQGSHSLTPLEPGELQHLVDTYRDAGMRINIDITGDMAGVSAAPRIVLHDVLREALTNVAKHARSPEATIRIGVDHGRVDVRVESPLCSRPPRADSGMGLAGLEHRVAAIGGTFHAQPDDRHWVVQARLPRRLVGAST
ncbi:sensor histidine kinase [Plantactinospora sp. BB1]|uniref:sensor histidine kinase n=1 Tax=Plantactinospora sp. BB1 TaxID=2071627 RepID=UPI00131EF32A|nr:histidine kinase [Plantactinospora sp. BB1]